MNIKESLVHWLGENDDHIQVYSAGKSGGMVIHFSLLERLSVNRNGQNFSDNALAWAEVSASALRVSLVDRLPTGCPQILIVRSASLPAVASTVYLAICSQVP
jgi:hypothetical protein